MCNKKENWLAILWESIENHNITPEDIIKFTKEYGPDSAFNKLVDANNESLRMFFRTVHDLLDEYEPGGFYIKTGDALTDSVMTWEEPINDNDNDEEEILNEV